MKTSVVVLLLAMVIAPFEAQSCEPSSDEWADYLVRSRQREEAYAASIAEKADEIFTGVVVDVSDLKSGPYKQLAHIKVDRVIKGDPATIATAAMAPRISPEDIQTLDRVAGCGEVPDPAQDPPYVVETYRFLFYVKDNVLLRANGFPVGPPPFSPNDEIKLLHDRGLVTHN
jgi:hypothetical protein